MRYCFFLLIYLPSYLLIAQGMMSEFYSVTAGIPQSQVISLAEDKKLGYLWVGTNGGGVAQFDGKIFKTYTVEEGLIDNTVERILIDSRDNVWFATPNGLSRFNGTIFKNFHFTEPAFRGLLELGDTIVAIGRNFDVLKIVSDSVLVLPDLLKGTAENPRSIKTWSNEVLQLTNNTVLFNNKDGVSYSIDVSHVGEIYNIIDVDRKYYLVTSSGTYKVENQKIQLFDARINFKILLANSDFSTVWKNDNSSLLEISRQENLKLDTLVKGVRTFTGMMDSEENYWFGMDGRGLLKRTRADFKRVQAGPALSIFCDKDQLWVGTNQLNVFTASKKIKQYVIKNESGQGFITAIKKDSKGNMWVLSGFTLTRIESRTGRMKKYTLTDGLRYPYINDIEIDNNDNIWICYRLGARLGVDLIKTSKHEVFKMNDQLSSPIVISAKYIPYGNRMLLFTKNGVDQYVDNKISRLRISRFDKTATYCATPYKVNSAIIGSEGRGICIYNFDTDSVRYFSKKEGLISGLIYFLNVDENGYVWIGSNKGIERVLFDEALNIKEYLLFGEANGLKEPETNFNASCFYGTEKYFGLIDGLYSYEHPKSDSINFPLHFTNISLINAQEDISLYGERSDGFFGIVTNVTLPHYENSIQFSFSKVSKKHPRSAEYKFMLAGLDTNWTIQSDENVSYRNLPYGDYSFKVFARNADGKWMDAPLSYSFVIYPPFYKRPLFIFLAFLFLGLLGFLSVYYSVKNRINKVVQSEKVRQTENIKLRREIGRDFHDEIGNQLARIVNYVGLIKLNQGNNIETLTRVEESAQNLIGGTKDFIWALDHANDSSNSLFIHLKDFGDRLFSEKEIQFRAYYEVGSDLALPIGYTRQINLIFKEAMTNAFKYSKSNQVSLWFLKVENDLEILFEDNGVGIPETKMRVSSGGLNNIRVRANRIHAELTIQSDLSGTRIKIRIKPN